MLGAESSGGRGWGFCAGGGIGSLIEGRGTSHCVGIGGTGGTSVSCGNDTAKGLMREKASDILSEFLHSTGDLIAMMLVGEVGTLSKEVGDAGAEETRLIALVCGKTVMPHLLTGRAGAGVNSGEPGSDGEGGGGRIATLADIWRTGERGRLSKRSLARFGGVVKRGALNETAEPSVVVY